MTNDQTERRCGTCRYWTLNWRAPEGRRDCQPPVPESVLDFVTRWMSPEEGTACPTWEPSHD